MSTVAAPARPVVHPRRSSASYDASAARADGPPDGLRLRTLAEVRAGALAVVLLATTPLARLLPVDVGVAAYAVVVVVAALVLPRGLAALVAVTAWGVDCGFVEHSGGQLVLDPTDLARLALLVGLAWIGASVGRRVDRAAQRGTRTSTRPWTQVSSSSRPGPIESPSS